METSSKAYTGLLFALVVVGFLAYWKYDEIQEVDKLRIKIAADLDQLGTTCERVRRRVDVLAASSSSLHEIVEFLGLVSLSDHRPTVRSLQEWSQKSKALPAQIASFEARVKTLETSRSVSSKKEAEAALPNIAALYEEVRNFEDQLKEIEKANEGHTHTIAGILEEEQDHIYGGLRLFAASLDGVLNEVAVAEEHRGQGVVDQDATRATALNIARLAELLYMPESVVEKQQRILAPTPSLQAINAQLKVGQGQKLLLRKILSSPSREQMPTTVSFAAQVGSPWRVASLGLNVRVGPSVNTAVLCTLFQGDQVKPTRTEGYWWPAATSCGNGWVASKHLRRYR